MERNGIIITRKEQIATATSLLSVGDVLVLIGRSIAFGFTLAVEFALIMDKHFLAIHLGIALTGIIVWWAGNMMTEIGK